MFKIGRASKRSGLNKQLSRLGLGQTPLAPLSSAAARTSTTTRNEGKSRREAADCLVAPRLMRPTVSPLDRRVNHARGCGSDPPEKETAMAYSIVVGYDGSEAAQKALDVAVELAEVGARRRDRHRLCRGSFGVWLTDGRSGQARRWGAGADRSGPGNRASVSTGSSSPRRRRRTSRKRPRALVLPASR